LTSSPSIDEAIVRIPSYEEHNILPETSDPFKSQQLDFPEHEDDHAETETTSKEKKKGLKQIA